MSHCAFEVSAGVTSATSMAKNVFMEKKKLFTGKMNLEPKKRKMKCLVCESSTVCSRDMDVG